MDSGMAKKKSVKKKAKSAASRLRRLRAVKKKR